MFFFKPTLPGYLSVWAFIRVTGEEVGLAVNHILRFKVTEAASAAIIAVVANNRQVAMPSGDQDQQ
ncbi:hypothetical protein MES5069_40109 [Mesorhizobium escarrei]|uniref:Uncharacterized protein n=1 Tax=Mesorhizobium escarrei TaxID=666018 RepID=A0ABM9E407_9HYPH|nr:hypothetical protein MES5069_40109 [Mesorhizobium escarrei]